MPVRVQGVIGAFGALTSFATFHVPVSSAVGVVGALVAGFFVIRSRVIGSLRDDRDTYKDRAETLAAEKIELVAEKVALEQQKDTVGLQKMMAAQAETLKKIDRNLTDLHNGQNRIILAVVPPADARD